MSFHVVAYTCNTFGVNNFSMTPAQDAIMPISNAHYFPNIPMYCFGGWLSGTLMNAIRMYTPRTRALVPPPLYPINGSTLPADRPHIFDRRNNPITLNQTEEVDMQVNLGGAANAISTALMFWGPSLDPIPPGDIYSIHGTASTAATALAWSQITPTWDQPLPSGQYTVVGSQHQSTNAIGHRWIFRGATWRPGAISQTSLQNIAEPSQYIGGWGVFGTFPVYAYPSIEVFCNGTDAAHDITMFFIKTG